MALRPQAVDKCCTDIACKPNGHADAIAFIRVHFASGDPRNTIIGPLYPGTTRWTNNRVHLTAILEALNILRTSTYKELEILTHNKLTATGMGMLPVYRKHGFYTLKGKDLANKDLWLRAAMIMATFEQAGRKVSVRHLPKDNYDVPGNTRRQRLELRALLAKSAPNNG